MYVKTIVQTNPVAIFQRTHDCHHQMWMTELYKIEAQFDDGVLYPGLDYSIGLTKQAMQVFWHVLVIVVGGQFEACLGLKPFHASIPRPSY